MVRRVIFALIAGLALPVAVSATDQSIELTANVAKFCKFDADPTIGSLNNMTVVSSSTSASVLDVTTATGPTGIMNTAGFNFQIQATCNFPSQVTLTTLNGGLTDASPEPISSGTFLRRIDYNVTSLWNGAGVGILATTGVAGQTSPPQAAPHAHSGPLQVIVSTIANTTAPLAAGDYTDTLKISLVPQ
ncbi:MAG: hypothetical protein KDJ37_00275 [Hyphomicrobiaceae bacterium]|nr:hypothetical protein [Hyphomicrobiaceae bacterium]